MVASTRLAPLEKTTACKSSRHMRIERTFHIMSLWTRSTALTWATRPAGLQRILSAGFASKANKTAPANLHRKPVDGKNVIVTGSARGIGKSIALRLATDGYNVCINDIGANAKACDEVVKEIRSLGQKACSAIADVSKRAEVKELVQKAVKELGPLHTMYEC